MSFFKHLTIISFGLFLLFLGSYHLSEAKFIQYDFVANGTSNLYFSTIIFYVFVATEFTVGCLTLLKKKSTLFFSLFSFILFTQITFNIYFQYPSNFLFKYNYLYNVLLQIFLLALVLIFLKSNYKKVKNWLTLILFFVFSGAAIVFNPIYIEDYQSETKPTPIYNEVEKGLEEFCVENHFIEKDRSYILAFISTSCPHCIDMAKKLYASSLSSSKNTEAILIFSDTEENIHLFVNHFHLFGIKTLNISKGEFIKYSHSLTPFCYLVKNKKVVNRWVGDHFNYPIIDAIF